MNRALHTPADCHDVTRSPDQLRALADQLARHDPGLERLAGHYALLGGHTRLRILTVLQNAGEMGVCDLAAVLGVSPAAISQHLTRLRAGGMVLSRRDGLTVQYRCCARAAGPCPELPRFEAGGR